MTALPARLDSGGAAVIVDVDQSQAEASYLWVLARDRDSTLRVGSVMATSVEVLEARELFAAYLSPVAQYLAVEGYLRGDR